MPLHMFTFFDLEGQGDLVSRLVMEIKLAFCRAYRKRSNGAFCMRVMPKKHDGL